MKRTLLSLGVFFVSNAFSAEPIDSWTEYPLPAGASYLLSVAFGNGTFVAVGADSTIIASANGADWTKATVPVSVTSISRVRFLNNHFITTNPSMISTNGLDWSVIANPQPSNHAIQDITYLDGVYYAVGFVSSSGMPGMVTSTDLVNWTDSPAPNLSTIAAGNGAVVAGQSPLLNDFYYLNAGAWQRIPNYPSFRSYFVPSEITFQNGMFLTIRNFQNWTFSLSRTGVDAEALSYSSDGITWNNAMALDQRAQNLYCRRAAAGAGYYVFPAGTSLYYSQTLTPITEGTGNWTEVNLNLANPIGISSDVAFGNNVFVAVTLGKIFRSGLLTGIDPLHIASQPKSVSALAGATTKLSVLAQGSDPITYQWRHEGTNLVGETSNSLTLANITASAGGRYEVEITNPAGSITSDPAIVTVNFANMLLYAGVTLYGNVGDKFLLEYQDSLNPSSPWTSLGTITLASSKYIYIDYDSAASTNRYYRATFQP